MNLHRPLSLILTSAIITMAPAAADPAPVTEPALTVEGYWLTDDGSLIIEIAACYENGETLCGFVRALPTADSDAELASFANELCGQPLMGEFRHNTRRDRWTGGEIYDPETAKAYSASIWVEAAKLRVQVFETIEAYGQTFQWTRAEASISGCEGAAGD